MSGLEKYSDLAGLLSAQKRESHILRPFNPISWFHPVGIHKVLARLKPKLPDVSGCLFITLTFNPMLFANPSLAFETGRDRLRRIFYKLRRGVMWNGKHYRIDAPYDNVGYVSHIL